MTKDLWVAVSEAAEKSGYSDSYVRRLAHDKKIRSRRFGPRAIVVNLDDLLAHKAEMERLGTAKHAPHRDEEGETCSRRQATAGLVTA